MIPAPPMPNPRICTNVRNPIRCKCCDSQLVAESLRDADAPEQAARFEFLCPVCRRLNDGVHLEGFALIEVFKDPRTVPRQA